VPGLHVQFPESSPTMPASARRGPAWLRGYPCVVEFKVRSLEIAAAEHAAAAARLRRRLSGRRQASTRGAGNTKASERHGRMGCCDRSS